MASNPGTFADKCGINTPARQTDVARVLALAEASGLEWIRLVWCDVHGSLRGKTWVTSELATAFAEGMGMVSTLMLKDTSDRTVYKVFEANVKTELPGFEGASNVMLLPDPSTFKILPCTTSQRTSSLLLVLSTRNCSLPSSNKIISPWRTSFGKVS